MSWGDGEIWVAFPKKGNVSEREMSSGMRTARELAVKSRLND